MKRNEIWLVNLDPTLGAEIQKTRPAIIVNDDALGLLPLRITVPITDWKSHYASAVWMVKIIPNSNNNLSKISSADCFQVRSISTKRFIKKIGVINTTEIEEIETALANVLKIV
jgi:mRNA interferase MazF